jgi:transposase
LRRREIAFTCPEKSDQIARRRAKGAPGGRPPVFDQAVCADRNVVERCFNRSTVPRPATRYAKRSASYQAEVTIAAIVLWCRRTELQDTP